jgi:hypothetical protein
MGSSSSSSSSSLDPLKVDIHPLSPPTIKLRATTLEFEIPISLSPRQISPPLSPTPGDNRAFPGTHKLDGMHIMFPDKVNTPASF